MYRDGIYIGTLCAKGCFLANWFEGLHITSYVGSAEEKVGLAGYWLRRDGVGVRIMRRGVEYTCDSYRYDPALGGRLRDDLITTYDLVKQITVEEFEALKDARPKKFNDYLNEGFFLRDNGVTLVPMSAAWHCFMLDWVEYVNKNSLSYRHVHSDAVIRAITRQTSDVPFSIQQLYLLDKYRVQQHDISIDKYNLDGYESVAVLREDDAGKVYVIQVPRAFIHGGHYGADVRPVYHNPRRVLNQYNMPFTTGTGRTFNASTNWYHGIEDYVAFKAETREYKLVPTDFPAKFGTGVHISTQDPNLLAYFPTQRHAERRVPQQIKPGRYIRQYFPHYTDDQVRRYSALIGTGKLKFYADWQNMLKIYTQLDNDGIVSSCMSKDRWGTMHPLMVYDNSDVELAVLYMGDKPVARALYNKHNKHYPMVYGQWEKMSVALDEAGFIHDSLCGAKIRKLPRYLDHSADIDRDTLDLDTVWDHAIDVDYLLMPYIDHKRDLDRSHNCSTEVSVHDDYCEIDYRGGIEANNHEEGYIHRWGDNRAECENCDDRVHENDLIYVEYDEMNVCPYCRDNYTVNVHSGRRSSFTAMTASAEHRFVYVSNAGEWFEDNGVAHEFGWCYSEDSGDYLHEDDCVWVSELDDYIASDEIGRTIQYDDVESEYVPIETYEARMNEREQDLAA
jgi:hypothetical protein